MTNINVMQPNSLSSLTASKPVGSSVSNEPNQLDESKVSQSIERTKEDIRQVKTEETHGQIEQVQLDTLMEKLNVELEKLQNYLRFERDESSDKMVIFVKNSETDEVIRQIPTQEFMTISKNISSYLEMRQQPFQTVATPLGLITSQKA